MELLLFDHIEGAKVRLAWWDFGGYSRFEMDEFMFETGWRTS